MLPEIREIPPAPRRVRWRAVVHRRWPIGFVGIALGGFGSLLTCMLWFGATSSHYAVAEQRLDRGAVQIEGTVVAIEPLRGRGGVSVRYHFPLGSDGVQAGQCFVREPEADGVRGSALIPGATIVVDYLDDEPGVSRMRGGHVAFIVPWHRYGFAFAVLPGMLALAVWFLGMLGARSTIARGDVAIAERLRVTEIPLLIPTLLDVRFEFRDRQARVRSGRHLVAARSRIGRIARRDGSRLAVVHDREHPNWHHLVVPEDFLITPPRDA